MSDRTNAERQAALRQRERAAGLYRITVAVPMERVHELRELVRRWKAEAEKNRGGYIPPAP